MKTVKTSKVLFWFFGNLIPLIPNTRLYGLKSMLYRWCGVKIGKHTRIHSKAIFDNTNIVIGENSFIGGYVRVIGHDDASVNIGDNCDIGPNCLLVTGTHELSQDASRRAGIGVAKPIHIGNGVWIGANVTVLPGVTVGNGAMIGAGSLITQNIQDNVMAYGVPAKVVRKIE